MSNFAIPLNEMILKPFVPFLVLIGFNRMLPKMTPYIGFNLSGTKKNVTSPRNIQQYKWKFHRISTWPLLWRAYRYVLYQAKARQCGSDHQFQIELATSCVKNSPHFKVLNNCGVKIPELVKSGTVLQNKPEKYWY